MDFLKLSEIKLSSGETSMHRNKSKYKTKHLNSKLIKNSISLTFSIVSTILLQPKFYKTLSNRDGKEQQEQV